MKSGCHSGNLGSSEGITSFKCFDSFLRLFALALLELGSRFWIVVARERRRRSFAGAGWREGRGWADIGFKALIFLQLTQFTKE